MKSNQERFASMVPAFEAAIVDGLKIQADASGGVYIPSTDGLKAAAFPAIKEVIESEVDPVSPMLAIAVWEAVMHSNESAFRQVLERKQKAGTLPFKISTAKDKIKSTALQYC